MKYAVVSVKGKQYSVTEGQQILLDGYWDISDKNQTINNVLLIKDEDKLTIGTPEISGAKVAIELLENTKGDKINILKYKAKSRYKKRIGHRPQLTKALILSIAA